MHGTAGSDSWEPPKLVVKCNEVARPGYTNVEASEYVDTDATLSEKVAVMTEMIKQARETTVYSGAGISTSCGVADYATRAKDSLSSKSRQITSPLMAQPSPAHCILVSMYRAGLLKHWVQQNHDGLPQKAGLPQAVINEIHGAWYDPSNPVVQFSESLREDLFSDLLEIEQRTDLCLAVGTSLSGMNADRVATTAAARATKTGKLGLVIIGLQRTQHDKLASLRIFAKIDDVFLMLAKSLALESPVDGLGWQAPPYRLVIPPKAIAGPNIFRVRYDTQGRRNDSAEILLNLNDGAKLRIVGGKFNNCEATVNGDPTEAGYNIIISVPPTTPGAVRHRLVHGKLGLWWIHAAVYGEVKSLPVVPT